MKRTVLNLFGALAVGSALSLQPSTALAQGTSYKLLTTFTNPTPAYGDGFGAPVAAVGSDRVLIGATHDNAGATAAGVAYLFSINGTLLLTFTNPTPAGIDFFSSSLAVVGDDRVIIGTNPNGADADSFGSAYLFNTNGTLLVTFTNPTPVKYDHFGISVATVGTDGVLIGAYADDRGADAAGAAFLFSTNGTLLTVFTNPTPAHGDFFGASVAIVGSSHVLVGAYRDDTSATDAGAAYLFSTNGTLITTFTNPTPAAYDYFGLALVAVGSDKVLIGASGDYVRGTRAGAAYLFSTNGTLLATFTSPIPTTGDIFGVSLAMVGTDKVLIGASSDYASSTNAGAAYLFTTSGTLLATFTKPVPGARDGFGSAVAVVGNNRVLIGAYGDNTGADHAGAAYLFSIPAPSLTIRLTPINRVAISWPSPSTGWTLQQNTDGMASANWSNVLGPIQDDGTTKTLLLSPPTGERFFRLVKP